jgi:hypothetical protein
LTGVNHEEYLVVPENSRVTFVVQVPLSCTPLLLPHLLESVSDVKGTNFFIVLEFQELVAAMPSHIDEDVRPVVSEKAF